MQKLTIPLDLFPNTRISKRRIITEISPQFRWIKLRKTVDDVINLLRYFNIKQKKYENLRYSASCPISQYVKRATHKKDVGSCQNYIRIGKKNKATTTPIADFINGFDSDLYPEFKA